MGKNIKILANDRGEEVGLTIDPQAFTRQELTELTRARIFSLGVGSRRCTIVTSTKTVFVDPEYLRDVSRLNRQERDRHIRATERTIEVARTVTILYGHSPERR